jgi:hypothetical protein
MKTAHFGRDDGMSKAQASQCITGEAASNDLTLFLAFCFSLVRLDITLSSPTVDDTDGGA